VHQKELYKKSKLFKNESSLILKYSGSFYFCKV